MKFTHRLFTNEGWNETTLAPSDFKEVQHLGRCPFDGDMFASYYPTGVIEIFKGVLEEETLKTNTWYRNKHNSSLLAYRTGDKENYAISDNIEVNDWHCATPEFWQEATEEEVEETLIKLAKKKGFKNIDKLKFKDPYGDVFEKGYFIFEGNEFTFEDNTLYLDGVVIFKNGKWAEILEEEVEDKNPLNLKVGREYLLQYVHCKSEPKRVKITRFTKDGYPWMEGVHCDTNGIVSPRLWKLIEEAVKKDYEILSYQSKDKIIAPATNFAIEITKLGHWNIHSIKKLSDGEVFTVGDKVTETITGTCSGWRISEFSLKDTRCFTAGVSINNIEKIKQPLFKSEDGVDIFEDDIVYSVRLKDLSLYSDNTHECFYKKGFKEVVGFKYFSTKETAEEYILMNKPCLSINDIVNNTSFKFMTVVNELKEKVKSKL